MKICDAFKARRYELPDMDDAPGVKKLMNDNYTEMHDARLVLLKVRRFLVVPASDGWCWRSVGWWVGGGGSR